MPFLKRLVLVLLAATLLVPSAPAAAEEDFRFVYFPHADTESSFANDWGDPRSGGRRHQGNDIFGAKHSPVVAVADGFVSAIGRGNRSGFYVRLVHRDGWETWYMHLNNDSLGSDDGSGGPEGAFAPGLEEGMFVSAGTVIGFVGDSGNAERSSSHTHFELHDGRRAVNPYTYLSEAYERWLRVLELSDKIR